MTCKKSGFRRATEGVIAIMLVLLMIPITTIVFLCIEAGRYQNAMRRLDEIIASCEGSVLAEYDSYLLDRFGLLAINQPVDSAETAKHIKEKFDSYLSMQDTVDMRAARAVEIITEANGLYPLASAKIVLSQLRDSSLTNGLLRAVLENLHLDELLDTLMKSLQITHFLDAITKIANCITTIYAMVGEGIIVSDAKHEIKQAQATLDITHAVWEFDAGVLFGMLLVDIDGQDGDAISSQLDTIRNDKSIMILAFETLEREIQREKQAFENYVSQGEKTLTALISAAQSANSVEYHEQLKSMKDEELKIDYEAREKAIDEGIKQFSDNIDQSKQTLSKHLENIYKDSFAAYTSGEPKNIFDDLLALVREAKSKVSAIACTRDSYAPPSKGDLFPSEYKKMMDGITNVNLIVTFLEGIVENIKEAFSSLKTVWDLLDYLVDFSGLLPSDPHLTETVSPPGSYAVGEDVDRDEADRERSERFQELIDSSPLVSAYEKELTDNSSAIGGLLSNLWNFGKESAAFSDPSHKADVIGSGKVLVGEVSGAQKVWEGIKGFIADAASKLTGQDWISPVLMNLIEFLFPLNALFTIVKAIISIMSYILTFIMNLANFLLTALITDFTLATFIAFSLPNRTNYLTGKTLTGYKNSDIYRPKSNVTNNPYGGLMGAEAEYVLFGDTDETKNQEAAYLLMLIIRMFINVGAVFADETTNKLITSLAETIIGIIVAVILLFILVFIESYLDITMLCCGDDCPLIKTGCWITHPKELLSKFNSVAAIMAEKSRAHEELGEKKSQDELQKKVSDLADENKGFSAKLSEGINKWGENFTNKVGFLEIDYSAYMLIFGVLFSFVGSKTLLGRIQDVIVMEKSCYNNAPYDLSQAFTAVRATAKGSLSALLPVPGFNDNPSILTFDRLVYRGY